MALSNFLSILQAGRQGQRVAPQNPMQAVLEALRRSQSIPLTDVVKATALRPEDALEAIEKLRAENLVEVVEAKGTRLLRLTPAGYAMLSSSAPA